MIEGAIFDLDGTLLDSMFIWETVGETYLRSLGYEPKEDINRVFKNLSLYQAACYYKSEYGVPMTAQELMNGVNKTVEDYYFNMVDVKNGVKEFLQSLSDGGVKMCIATATDRYQVETALKRCGISHYFTEIFTCSEVGCGKDEPVIYRKALKHLGTEKSKTAVFEDALYAVKTAKNDGFTVVGVYDEYAKEQKEIRELCDIFLKDYLNTEDFWKLAEGVKK